MEKRGDPKIAMLSNRIGLVNPIGGNSMPTVKAHYSQFCASDLLRGGNGFTLSAIFEIWIRKSAT